MADQRVRVEREAASQGIVVARGDAYLESGLPGHPSRVSSPTLDFDWRSAPRLEASVAASTLACLVRWFRARLRSAMARDARS